ncbi:hypothetical protein [Actinokineospora globicatena]|uniref:hypothetical protein n=1 Tax=Actinokineospora globicatena TaxID=103729 RepID=UPI0020A5A14C|nr:hypothetical protein [Actinokineospora globicatena]MCP2304297.1 hypothetical protein [Actinokineospora globicatena]GLW78341.1 hypothetical protein Aglo01_28230 [Actinokineospora globicatena]GLW84995.1 hypothetical protein Aglo02_26350 [Actinokineospora globicatena]
MDTTGMHRVVAAEVTRMAEYETGFWAIVDGLGVDRGYAGRLLDAAVDRIGTGGGGTADPYALVLSWMPC